MAKRQAAQRDKEMSYAAFAQGARSIYGDAALEIGHVINGWSLLHANLLDLMNVLMARHRRFPAADDFEREVYSRHEMAYKLWADADSDARRRQMLKVVIEDRLFEKRYADLKAAAMRALDAAGDLNQYRNDAVHMPLAVVRDGAKTGSRPSFVVTFDSSSPGRSLQRVVHAKSIQSHYRAAARDLYALALFVKRLVASCRENLDSGTIAKAPLKAPRPPKLQMSSRPKSLGRGRSAKRRRP